jgi:hypothetical protein
MDILHALTSPLGVMADARNACDTILMPGNAPNPTQAFGTLTVPMPGAGGLVLRWYGLRSVYLRLGGLSNGSALIWICQRGALWLMPMS